MSQFDGPGAIRNIETHPSNSQIVCAATSEGFFRTDNALDPTPTWSLYNTGIGEDQYLRGLCYKPSNPSVMYTSGLDIYRSLNGGDTWNSMTGPDTELDLEALPDNFQVGRINIAVTPANPELLYAYVVGQYDLVVGQDARGYVFKFDGATWEQIEMFETNGSTQNVIHGGWIGIAVSPVEEDFVVIGYTKLRARRIDGQSFTDIVGYNETGCHADVHDIEFLPTGTESDIYVAHHGGISIGEVGLSGLDFSYSYLCNGLGTSTIWTFDINESRGEAVIIGTQDNGSTYIDDFATNWKQIGGGDGYMAAISNPLKPVVYYGVNSPSNRNMFPLSSTSNYTLTPESVQYSCCNAIIPRSFEDIHVSLTKKDYFSFTEVYERLKLEESGDTWEDVWKYSSDIGLVPIFNNEGESDNKLWRHQIRPLEVSQRNPNVVFVSVPGYDMGTDEPSYVKPALLKSETGFTEGVHDPLNPTFFDVTPNLPTIPGTGLAPVITGVVTDPYNEDHVWVSFTGFHETLKVWESFDGGDNWVNADSEGSLYNLPVNDIVVQNGTRNSSDESRLFIATDAGVYVKEPGEDCWMKYGLIPNVRVTKLRLKACENTIYAATYGRGVWKADLPAPTTALADVEINANITWEDERFFTNSIRITNGNTLTVKNTLFMPEHGRIIVEPNARLIVDGGTITSGCEKFWQGIELWGTTGATQTVVSGVRQHGYLQMKNDGTIENAREGVTNWKPGDWNAIGGVIDARDGEFRNCWRAVSFMKHQNIHPYTGNPASNRSKFKETKFIINDDYVGDFETDSPFAQVSLWGVDGVTFSGCEFVNTSTVSSSEMRSKGIYSEDAHYKVLSACATTPNIYTGCPVEDVIPSVFDGFYRGIEASTVTDVLPILVQDAKFTNNMVGVELANVDFSEVIKSEFEMGAHPHEAVGFVAYANHLGVYSNWTRYIVVEENEFYKASGSPWESQNGVFVLQSEENSNNIYLNKFSNLKHGIIGYQVNRDENGFIGLQFTCNDMTNNHNDFIISRNELWPNSEDSGIRTYQGNLTPVLAAGNSFSAPNGVSNAYTNWDINSDPNYLYFHATGESPDPNEITPNKIFSVEVAGENACLTNYDNSGHQPALGIGDISELYNDKRNDYFSLLYAYNQVIDAGNTEGTIDDVIAMWPTDAWDLRDMLMARSPHNSETVLIAAAEREIMPHAMLLEVLLSNPDALRSGRLIDYLRTKLSNPLPPYMIDILKASTSQKTLRTTMENALGNHHAEMSRSFNFIIQHYTTDTLNGVNNDSLLHYLKQVNSPTGKYNLAGRYMNVGNYTKAINIIDSIPLNYKLTVAQNNEWKAVKSFFKLLKGASANGRNIASLDSTELVQLGVIAADQEGGIGALRARKALCFFYQNCIDESAMPKNKNRTHKKPLPPLEELLSDIDEVSAFPNPASEYLTFSYQFFKEKGQRDILIYNPNGVLVQSFKINDVQQGQQLWDTRNIKPGTYIYEVIEGARKINSGKVVIQ